MKKILAFVAFALVLLLAACGGNDSDNGSSEETAEITVGASSTPHAEILEEAQPLLEEQGITLHIEEYQDYILPNDDLDNGTLDANYFQHIPYLNQTVEDTGYEIESIGAIHVEPMGVYSKGIASVDDIEDGTEVILSNSVSDHGRVLALFEQEGLITLDESVEKSAATIDNIVDNPKNLVFSPDYEPAFLPELYESEDDTLAVINTNYAIGAGLNPLEDALFIEGEESEYVNVIAVRSEDADNEGLKKLIDVLHSEEIQNFITENYEGAVVPVGGSN
ncbi:MetQ/NlpA family ABC transporter substrate-binding protein [Oceanobacillus polygoni]|uniref:Lipoprotein n=1 Tax=Oceanobacillus polygoni TaxID=1235259 RepID=A0A9X1CDS3_9BACI|nr:MetQ/NlpA family ABC transporter substrate-binding protein [Oceanobacillus polygoni]MBP2076510.1 D-methionine transport system substrate-binding protein [Oceanobacillus polygoni]